MKITQKIALFGNKISTTFGFLLRYILYRTPTMLHFTITSQK